MGSTDVDTSNGSYLSTYYFTLLFIPIFPICRYRVIREGNSYRFLGKAPLRTGDKWHLVIALGIIGWFIISAAISGSSQSSTSNSSTYSPDSSGSHTYGQPSFSGTTSGGNSEDGDNQREQLRKRSLANEKEAIESERATVQALVDQVKNLAREIEDGRPYVDRTSEYQVNAFNAKITRYDALFQQAQSAEAAFNRKVDEYNAKVRGDTSPSPDESTGANASNSRGETSSGGPDAARAIPEWALQSNTSAATTPAPAKRPMGTVKIARNDTLNVRSDASTDSAIVGKLRSGDHVYLETGRVVNSGKGVPVTWQKITSFGGFEGWVNADYISTTDYYETSR
jgi:uncharacterized protein YgiM (DUF1202 family)